MYPHPAWKVPLSLFSVAEGEFMCKCVTSTTEPPVGPTFLHQVCAHLSVQLFPLLRYGQECVAVDKSQVDRNEKRRRSLTLVFISEVCPYRMMPYKRAFLTRWVRGGRFNHTWRVHVALTFHGDKQNKEETAKKRGSEKSGTDPLFFIREY